VTDFTDIVVNWGTGMIVVLDCVIFDRVRTGEIIWVIDGRIDWAGTEKLRTNEFVGRVGKDSTFKLLGPNHRPVIVVFVDRRASSHDDVGLGGSDGVVADSMGAAAALTVREGDELAGLVQGVVIGQDSSRGNGGNSQQNCLKMHREWSSLEP